MADQLATLVQVKAALKLTDANDDTYLTGLIEGVSEWITEYTGRRLVPEAGATYVVDTAAGSRIDVGRGIRAVTSLGVASSNQPDSGGTYTTVTAADILLRPSPIDRRPGWPATYILLRGNTARLGAWLNGATITGDFGFAATPLAITQVTIDAVAAAYQARRVGASGVMGADDTTVVPWKDYFGWGSPQRQTLMRYRGATGQGIG